MKYCKKCKHIYKDAEESCSFCKKPRGLFQIDDVNTPVYLTTAGSMQLKLLEGALEDAGIPFDKAPREIHTHPDLFGSHVGENDVLVPFSAYDKAYDVCVGIGAINIEGEETRLDELNPEEAEDSEFDEKSSMSPAKRTTVKIASAILLIIIFCAVIWGVDSITGLIKGLFS